MLLLAALCMVTAMVLPAQTAKSRADLYTQFDTLFADTGDTAITPADVRAALKDAIASSYNPLDDGSPSSGSVTSVALALPNLFSISGSPVTSTGTLTATFATQTANTVFAGPTSGSAATPAMRALVAADIPSLTLAKISDAGSLAALSAAPAGTLTGSMLASGVTSSSLTSFGNSPTLVTPTVNGNLTVAAGKLSIDAGTGSMPASYGAITDGNTMEFIADNATSSRIFLTAFGNYGTSIRGIAYGGTRASPTATTGSAVLLRLRGEVFNGTSVVNAATFSILADTTASDTNNGGFYQWYGIKGGETAESEWMRLFRGNLLVGTSSSTGLTGAGGLKVASTTASTSTTTGSGIFAGGIGVAGDSYFGGWHKSTVAAPAWAAGTTNGNEWRINNSTGDAGGTSAPTGHLFTTNLSGANAFGQSLGMGVYATHAGSATVATLQATSFQASLSSTGSVTTLRPVVVTTTLSGTGGVSGSVANILVSTPTVSSTGDFTGTISGVTVQNIGRASATTITIFDVAAQTKGSGNLYAYRGQNTSGSGKYNLYMDGTAENYLGGLLNVADTTEATTGGAGAIITSGGIYAAKKIISTTDGIFGGTLTAGSSSTVLTDAAGKVLSAALNTVAVAQGGTGITSLGTGMATWWGTPSSANLAATLTDETGSGAAVFGTSPTISDPTFTGTSTIGGASAATINFPNAGDTNITATGAIIFAPTLRFNGAIKDSAGSAGSDGDSLISTGTAVVWRTRKVVPLPYITTASAWTVDTTANFLGGSNGYRNMLKFDASGYTQARISVTVGSTAPVANTLVYARYYTSSSQTFSNFLAMGTSSADVQVSLPNSGGTCTVGSWVDLVSGAKADIFMIVGGVAPSGSTSISPQNVTVEFR